MGYQSPYLSHGYQSPYLSHAKRALYHLSYIPTLLAPQNLKFPVINNSENALYHLSYIPTLLAPQNLKFSVINNSENEEISLLNMSWLRNNWKEITYLIIDSFILEMRGTDPRTSRMQSERSTFWATSPRFLCHKTLNVLTSIIVKMKKYRYSLCHQ